MEGRYSSLISLVWSLGTCENGPSRPSHNVGCRLLDRGFRQAGTHTAQETVAFL